MKKFLKLQFNYQNINQEFGFLSWSSYDASDEEERFHKAIIMRYVGEEG